MAQRKSRKNKNEVELAGGKYGSAPYMDSNHRNSSNLVEKFLLSQRRRKEGFNFLEIEFL